MYFLSVIFTVFGKMWQNEIKKTKRLNYNLQYRLYVRFGYRTFEFISDSLPNDFTPYKAAENSPENKFKERVNNSCKNMSSVTKLKLNLYYVKNNSYSKFKLKPQFKASEKSKKTKFYRRTITPAKLRKALLNSNSICIMSRQIHVTNFKSISKRTTEKSLEN